MVALDRRNSKMQKDFHLSVLRALWQTSKIKLIKLRKEESALRTQLIATLFDDLLVGKNEAKGFRVICKENITLAKQDEVFAVCREISDKFPQVNINEILNWSMSLNVSVYKTLPDAARIIFDQVITIKPAMPTLSLIDAPESEEF